MEKTTELLYEEQERILQKLKTLEPGTKEYQAVREDAEHLGSLLNKTNESEINSGIAIEAQELNEKNSESDRKWNKVKIIGGVVGIALTFVAEVGRQYVYRKTFEDGIDFEKDGNVSSFFNKDWFRGIKK